MFSYDTPLSPGGLYVNLNSWQAFGEEFVQLDAQRSGQALYLLQQFQKVRAPACMILLRAVATSSAASTCSLACTMHRLHLPKPRFSPAAPSAEQDGQWRWQVSNICCPPCHSPASIFLP